MSSDPISLLKQGHPEKGDQAHIQVAFENLQDSRPNNFSEQPVPMLHNSHNVEMFPDVQMQLPVLLFVPIASRSGTVHY